MGRHARASRGDAWPGVSRSIAHSTRQVIAARLTPEKSVEFARFIDRRRRRKCPREVLPSCFFLVLEPRTAPSTRDGHASDALQTTWHDASTPGRMPLGFVARGARVCLLALWTAVLLRGSPSFQWRRAVRGRGGIARRVVARAGSGTSGLAFSPGAGLGRLSSAERIVLRGSGGRASLPALLSTASSRRERRSLKSGDNAPLKAT